MKLLQIFKKNKDVYLASYPRSGNTWIRTLMAYLYYDNPKVESLMDLQKYIPDEHVNKMRLEDTYKVNGQFRIIKTHDLNRSNKFKKVIYIYRNPIDVAWSYYNFLKETKHLSSENFDEFVSNFLSGNILFGSWENHIKSWLSHDNKLVISYEDFASNTYDTITKINAFLQVFVADDKIKNATTLVTPELVKKITDDELFYGLNKPSFVNTPLNENRAGKENFYNNYANRIKECIKIYDFERSKLIKR